MLAIARYALKSQFHASTVVGVLAVLSLFIPLISLLSGAIVGLIILTQGLYSGTRALLISIVGITAISYLITQSPVLGITIGVVQWVPVVILAEVLRRTSSLSFTLIAGMGLTLIAVAVQFLVWPDAEQFWSELMMQMLQSANNPQLDASLIESWVQSMVHWMTIMLMAVMYSTFVATLLAARWFQAKIAESDGYRDEFYSIHLGKSAAGFALLLIVINLVLQQDWLSAMLIVVLAGFLYQGIAILHSWSKQRKKRGLLILIYILMVIFPQVVGATALLGVIDNWMDFRKKLKSSTTE